jgi:hypothetical protein
MRIGQEFPAARLQAPDGPVGARPQVGKVNRCRPARLETRQDFA